MLAGQGMALEMRTGPTMDLPSKTAFRRRGRRSRRSRRTPSRETHAEKDHHATEQLERERAVTEDEEREHERRDRGQVGDQRGKARPEVLHRPEEEHEREGGREHPEEQRGLPRRQ